MSPINNIINVGFSVGLFINAILFLPQIIRLLQVKDAKELSLLTFVGFSLIQLFAVLHGIIAKDYILVIGYLVSLVTCSILTVFIVYYKLKNRK